MKKREVCREIALRLNDWKTVSVFGSQQNVAWDYFESEDASARLLEAMIPVALKSMYNGKNELVWDCYQANTGEYSIHPDRKTAIVLAACKWLGIEVDGITG